jgi:cell division protein FtsI/penicillin-binding protein 2
MVPKRANHYQKSKHHDRLTYLTTVVFVLVGLIFVRLGDLQIFQHSFYQALAEDVHVLEEKLIPKRGEIYVRDHQTPDKLYPLAANKDYYLIYAEPDRVKEPDKVAAALASVLELDQAEILPRLTKEKDLYEPLKHEVPEDKMLELKKLNLAGIKWQTESYRYYPEKNIGAHVLGFVGYQGDKKVGQYGLEGYWEKQLAGEMGFLRAEKDAQGRLVTFGTKLLQEAKDGDDLLLTLDHTIQYEACKQLNAEVQKHGADGGSLIIMDPATGAVIAMCGAPDFDPNEYQTLEDINTFINPATFYIYEPGSVFKAITMAAALDQGKVTPATTYTDTGSVEIGQYTIKNSDEKANGVQTMTQVLEKSLNTGAIFAARSIGPEKFEEYVKRFGFGQPTEIELAAEAQGNISTLNQHKEIYMATGSFGQGLSVTPLQLVTAFGAIANGGKLMKPYIVDEVIKPDGTAIKTEPKEVRQAISQKTAMTLGAMMVNVVRNGHGQRAGVPGYFVAGKTGTAQVPSANGPGYDPYHTIGTFCGFAPVEDPKFVMCVKMDKPKDVQWAESSAAPLFGDMAKFMLNYYGIPPAEKVE